MTFLNNKVDSASKYLYQEFLCSHFHHICSIPHNLCTQSSYNLERRIFFSDTTKYFQGKWSISLLINHIVVFNYQLYFLLLCIFSLVAWTWMTLLGAIAKPKPTFGLKNSLINSFEGLQFNWGVQIHMLDPKVWTTAFFAGFDTSCMILILN